MRVPAWIALTLVAAPSYALDADRAITQYVQTVWRMEEGLPHNSIRAVVQTRDGYLWLGTYGGLVRFDGVRFRVFDNRNSGLRDNEVRALAEDSEGALWVGTTSGGLHRLSDGSLLPWDDGVRHRTINALELGPDGTLWIGAAGGLYALRDGRVARVAEQSGLAEPFVNAIATSRAAVWLGTENGVFRLVEGRAERVPVAGAAASVKALLVDSSGGVWVGAGDAVIQLRFNAGQGATVESFRSVKDAWGGIYSLLEDRDGNLWAGSYGAGLVRITRGRLDRMSTEQGFLDHRPWATFEDREGSLWVGTRSGLARLRDGAARTWSRQEGLPAEIARTVMEDRDGTIWIGDDAGLSQLRDGRLRSFGPREGLPAAPVRSLLRDREGRLWVAADGGIAELDTASGRFRRFLGSAFGPSGGRARGMLRDRSGRVWLGTTAGVVMAPLGLDRGRFATPRGLEGLADQAIEALFEDREGGIWIGTINNGVRRFHDGRVETGELLAGASVGIRSFHQDHDGTLYIGTIGSGLFVRRGRGAFQRVTTRDGLPDDSVWSILADSDRLWMSSDRGVFPVSRERLHAFLDGRAADIGAARVLAVQDGMKSRECNGGGSPAGVRARDGRLWYPTSRGVVAIDPAKLAATNAAPPPAVIEEVVADRTPLAAHGGATAPPGTRDLEIHYTGLSLADPQGVRFRYRLHGYDKSWVAAGARRVAYYASVPPGAYRFELQAASHDGVWLQPGVELPLRVEPRFFEARWFRVVSGLGACALAGGVWWLRSARQRAREAELRRLVALRTEELQRANARLTQLAAVDAVTGIANHRRFMETAAEEWLRCRRDTAPLSVLVCDVDDFKAFNDRYGHPAGDACLRRVAEAIDAALQRATDLVARYGGDEFAIILPGTDTLGAHAVGEAVRSAVRALGIGHDASRAADCVTISVGHATAYPARLRDEAHAGSADDLIAAADHALYAAKAAGRDRVAGAADPAPSTAETSSG